MRIIRNENASDVEAIHAVHCAAFPSDEEARLVSLIRDNGNASISLVAEAESKVVGHILFSPVTIESGDAVSEGLGLAPVAVLPESQNQGIGSALVKEGLSACRAAGCPFVVVLGHPELYPRFGFERASLRGLSNEYGADEAFMVLELTPDSLPTRGLVKYGKEFTAFGKEC